MTMKNEKKGAIAYFLQMSESLKIRNQFNVQFLCNPLSIIQSVHSTSTIYHSQHAFSGFVGRTGIIGAFAPVLSTHLEQSQTIRNVLSMAH